MYEYALHHIENMGGSSCTCNARICNYHKQNGYGFPTGEAVITDAKQQDYLIDGIIKPFMDKDKSSVSQEALNKLRDAIAKASTVTGLELNQLCVEIDDSYSETKDTFKSATKEGYTAVKPTCGAIVCIIAAIIAFTFIGYLVYRYINCPCRKKREKELREAEKSLEYTT